MENSTITVQDVDTRWPFRAGYPRLLRGPIYMHRMDNNLTLKPGFDRIKPRINAILAAHNIPLLPQDPFLTFQKQLQNSKIVKMLRLIVFCTYDKEEVRSQSTSWAQAVAEIYAEYKTAFPPNFILGVELCDWEYMSTAHICEPPADSSRELLANWDEGHGYHRQITALFENRTPMYQAMLPTGLCAGNKCVYDWTTVIFFDALDARDEAWDEVETEMRAFLPDNIGIEIRQRVGLLHCDYSPQGLDADDCFARPPRPGCDISVQSSGNPTNGTMGGYVVTEDKNTKEKSVFGVTNGIVVLNRSAEALPKDEGNNIQSPCEPSRAKHKARLHNNITTISSEIQELKAMINARKETDPSLAQGLETRLKTAEIEAIHLQNRLRLAEQNPYIGSVEKVKFGMSLPDKLVMDLALIKADCLAGKLPQELFLKKHAQKPLIPENTTCDSWEVDSLGASMDADKHIKVVTKLSGTGVYTMGVVSSFRADIDFSGIKDGVMIQRKALGWAITTPRQSRAGIRPYEDFLKDGQGVFQTAGDAGSFIIAAAGWECEGYDNKVTDDYAGKPFVVGLLWGKSINADVSYFLPFDAVKAGIEALTGEDVVWPRKRSETLLRWEGDIDSDETDVLAKDVDQKNADKKDVDETNVLAKDIDQKDLDQKDADESDVNENVNGNVADKHIDEDVDQKSIDEKDADEKDVGENVNENVNKKDILAKDIDEIDVDQKVVDQKDVDEKDVLAKDIDQKDIDQKDVTETGTDEKDGDNANREDGGDEECKEDGEDDEGGDSDGETGETSDASFAGANGEDSGDAGDSGETGEIEEDGKEVEGGWWWRR